MSDAKNTVPDTQELSLEEARRLVRKLERERLSEYRSQILHLIWEAFKEPELFDNCTQTGLMELVSMVNNIFNHATKRRDLK